MAGGQGTLLKLPLVSKRIGSAGPHKARTSKRTWLGKESIATRFGRLRRTALVNAGTTKATRRIAQLAPARPARQALLGANVDIPRVLTRNLVEILQERDAVPTKLDILHD